jgi:hypothetical protein
LIANQYSSDVEIISDLKRLVEIRNQAAHNSSYFYPDESEELYIGWDLKSFLIKNSNDLELYVERIESAVQKLKCLSAKIIFSKEDHPH